MHGVPQEIKRLRVVASPLPSGPLGNPESRVGSPKGNWDILEIVAPFSGFRLFVSPQQPAVSGSIALPLASNPRPAPRASNRV